MDQEKQQPRQQAREGEETYRDMPHFWALVEEVRSKNKQHHHNTENKSSRENKRNE